MLVNKTMYPVHAHDLIWLKPSTEYLFQSESPEWVSQVWQINDPLVVRRDYSDHLNLIPVGVRGYQRNQRWGGWLHATDILTVQTPAEVALLSNNLNNQQQLAAFATFQTLTRLMSYQWPFVLGVTGSLAFSLATGKIWCHEKSDLDLSIRCFTKSLTKPTVQPFYQFIQSCSCRVDVQISSPLGGFSLAEWLSNDQVLLKTNHGPLMVDDPWQKESY